MEKLNFKKEILKEEIGGAQEIFHTEENENLRNISDKLEMNFDEFLKIGNREVLEMNYESDFLDKLPEGFFYKGGAARSAAERFLEINEESSPRDIDIVYSEEKKGEEMLIHELSEEYMADDYRGGDGYGAELLEENYFNTRDFTVNEILYDGKKIFATKESLIDLMGKKIRITDFEKLENWDGWNNSKDYNYDLEKYIEGLVYDREKKEFFILSGEIDLCLEEELQNKSDFELEKILEYKEKKEDFMNKNPFVKWKLLAKAVRFISEKNINRESIKNGDDIDDYENIYKYIESLGIDSFHIALHLDRALEGGGRKLGEKYLEQMVYCNVLPEDFLKSEDIIEKSVEFLENDLYDFKIEQYDKLKHKENSKEYDIYNDVKIDSKYEQFGENNIGFKNIRINKQ